MARRPLTVSAVEPVVLGALCAAVFLPSLGDGFVLDDRFYSVFNKVAAAPSRWAAFFLDRDAISADPSLSRIIYRPLVGISDGLNLVLGGRSPFWFHLHDILLHGLCVALVFVLARRLYGPGWKSRAAALLFGLHPVQAQSVVYFGSRAGGLSAAFVIGSLLAYSEGAAAWSWAAYALALLSKESSVVLLALLPAYDFAFGARREGLRARARRWAPYAALTGVFLLARTAVLGMVAQRGPWGGSWAAHGQLAAHALYGYLVSLAWPSALREPYGWTMGPGFAAESVAMGAAFFALAAASLWGLARRRPWGFGAFWFFVALAPMSNVVPFTALAADRFLYLSMAGGALALAAVLPARPGRPLLGLLAALGLAAVARTLELEPDWRSDFTLSLAATQAAPGEPYARLRLAGVYAGWRMYPQAEALAWKSQEPGAPPDVANLGRRRLAQWAIDQGRCDRAVPLLEASLVYEPKQDSVRRMLAGCAQPGAVRLVAPRR